ncbi:hypothetical protein [Rhodobaculum claviforme]|uniref:Uncharacterized protein n=1 Tax=Rhodobaculum claviforme TaxID=1549854 RepID=A0A934TLX4_9RHOB|nr:hypothetical protein [Rhodobaculum claviforme]MBK5927881.1 hypothetical protein [Rhodobaculum claviforme]
MTRSQRPTRSPSRSQSNSLSRGTPARRHVRSPRQHTPASIAEAVTGPVALRNLARPVVPARRTDDRRLAGWATAVLSVLGLRAGRDLVH